MADEPDGGICRFTFAANTIGYYDRSCGDFVLFNSVLIIGTAEQSALCIEFFRGVPGPDDRVVTPYDEGIVGPFTFVSSCISMHVKRDSHISL